MPRRRETPYSPIPIAGRHLTAAQPENGFRSDDDTSDLEMVMGNHRPETELQALMECAPGQEPEWSTERLLPLREIIGDAYELLDDEEVWVLDALLCERLSVRPLSDQVNTSKSRIDRIKHSALAKLAAALEDRPEIKEYLNR